MGQLWQYLYNDNSELPRVLFFEELPNGFFRYGLNADLKRSLFFEIPAGSKHESVVPVVLANIKLEETRLEGKYNLVLVLLNDEYKALFDDLITDIVQQTKGISSVSLKDTFISLCSKWFEFLQPSFNIISSNQLKGIFSELVFLKYLLVNSVFSYNEILDAWKGPYGKGHDFELGSCHFEIKGIDYFKNSVNISSEYQLDFLNGQNLFLVIFKFSDTYLISSSISEIVDEISILLRQRIGTNLRLFWNALKMTGVNLLALHELDSNRFFVDTINYYNVSLSDFPSITRRNLSDNIRSVNYVLSLNNLDNYKLTDITLYI